MTEENKQLPRKLRRPPSFTNADELEEKIIEFFAYCKEVNDPINFVGLAVFLGVCRDTLFEYGKGTYDHIDPEFSDTIKKAKDFIENEKWKKALKGEYHASVAIFDLKNNHGAKDAFEHVTKDGASIAPPSQQTIILTDEAIKSAVKELHANF